MQSFKQLMMEKRKEKEEKEKPIIFIETDPHEGFPPDTVTYLQKEINKKCKDLEIEWKDAIHLLNAVFEEFKVPVPSVFQAARWGQYTKLIQYTVSNLRDARGMKASWVKTI